MDSLFNPLMDLHPEPARLYALFHATTDITPSSPDDYLLLDFIGIFSSITDAVQPTDGSYTIITRQILADKKIYYRAQLPYNYIIEPVTVNEPILITY